MSTAWKIGIVVVLAAAVSVVIAMKSPRAPVAPQPAAGGQQWPAPTNSIAGALWNESPKLEPGDRSVPASPAVALPRLVDLGADKCIPCKMMAPILDELGKEYAGKFDVKFIDVWLKENAEQAKKHGIKVIPTQIFFDANGKELWRHEGFISKQDILAKWKELGFTFNSASALRPPQSSPTIERWEPAKADSRAKHDICYMCDGDVNPKTPVVVKTAKGDVRLCSPHCYFIMYSCLTEDKTGFEKKVSVTDYASGKLVPLTEAALLLGQDEATGRPWIRTFASREAAVNEQKAAGGSILGLAALQQMELSHRCGFCDRACYPQDAAEMIAAGVHTWGCCSHCALGVAARTGLDIEVRERDRLTGEPIIVKTVNGSVASVEPKTAVAWFGMRTKPDGTKASAGCFHQGFFVTPDNLRAWLDKNPLETGKLITINQALADKMKLSPEQIQKACKIGECAPK
ncbi:MAG TPA: organomercurial lyase [Planctomycetota bacterium]|nr:organomercurial lyase [Planctomycetota bacterium]